MAMEQSKAGIVCEKIHGNFLVPPQHHDIFNDTRCWNTGQICQLETMAVKMNRMQIVTLVAQMDAVTSALLQMKRRRSRGVRPWVGDPIDCPAIETLDRGVLFGKCQLEALIRRRGACSSLAETRVVPAKLRR